MGRSSQSRWPQRPRCSICERPFPPSGGKRGGWCWDCSLLWSQIGDAHGSGHVRDEKANGLPGRAARVAELAARAAAGLPLFDGRRPLERRAD